MAERVERLGRVRIGEHRGMADNCSIGNGGWFGRHFWREAIVQNTRFDGRLRFELLEGIVSGEAQMSENAMCFCKAAAIGLQ